MSEFRKGLLEAGEEAGLNIDGEQAERCEAFVELLLSWNRQVNLTRITEPREVAVKHFVDSAAAVTYGLIGEEGRLIDVGTGAGFPGVVLKIFRPKLQLVLLDSLAKRLKFLDEVVQRMGWNDVELVHSRAEDVGRNKALRESFDVATARAVAELRVLAEYLLPLVRVGGKAIAWKGPSVGEEVAGAEVAVKTLGGGALDSLSFELPFGYGTRSLVVLPKERPTPKKYPRRAGEPSRAPLG